MNVFIKNLLKQNIKSDLKKFKNRPSLLPLNGIVIKQFSSNFSNTSNNFTQCGMKISQSKGLFYNFKSNNFTGKNFSFNFSDFPKHTKILMPCLAPDMEMGDFIAWKKKEGDFVKENDVIAEVENGKATVDFTCTNEGYLAKILVPAGTKKVKVGSAVCVLVEDKNQVAQFKDFKLGEAGASTPAAAPKKAEEIAKPAQPTQAPSVQTPSDRIIASPLAKKTAREEGIQLNAISGTGPNGRIIQEDVLKAKTTKVPEKQVEAPSSYVPSGVSAPEFEDIQISAVRKVTAERLTYSKSSVPHFYIQMECNVDKLMELRAELNKTAGVKISVNDIIIKAASLACMKVPEANSSWQGTFIRKYKNVDMSVAVQTDYGLITPIVTNSNLKGLAQISKDVKELAEKAKSRKLQPSEFIGGTFTISNMGMMGTHNFSAVINPPQACILAVGKSDKRVVYDANASDKNHPYKVVNMMNCTLSCDHRVVDGAFGAQWVQEFKNLIENPQLMLL